ncbi:MAG: signal peptidase II [Rhodospirillaceae bacterium]
MSPIRQRLALGLSLAMVVIIMDQLSKWWMVEVVMRPPRVIELTGWLNLVMTWNHGISFGLLSGTVMPYLLVTLALAVVGVLIAWLARAERLSAAFPLGLVIGGAVGNVIDRLMVGAVADFIDVHVGTWHWPAFNVADSAITIGVTLIIIDGLFGRPEIS